MAVAARAVVRAGCDKERGSPWDQMMCCALCTAELPFHNLAVSPALARLTWGVARVAEVAAGWAVVARAAEVAAGWAVVAKVVVGQGVAAMAVVGWAAGWAAAFQGAHKRIRCQATRGA